MGGRSLHDFKNYYIVTVIKTIEMENKLMPVLRDGRSRKMSMTTEGYYTKICGDGIVVYSNCDDSHTNLLMQ